MTWHNARQYRVLCPNTRTHMKYYIIDTTVKPSVEVRLDTYNQVVRHLEGMTQRAYNQTRKQRMTLLEECGHGYDDSNSVTFVRSMAERFEMGIIRNEAGSLRKFKCDITGINLFHKEEFGD